MVNAIVDTLKTAFPRSEPQSPTEDNEGEVDGKIITDKKSKYDHCFSDQNVSIYDGNTNPHRLSTDTYGWGGMCYTSGWLFCRLLTLIFAFNLFVL